MKNKKNVPDIRFKGFAEEWDERQLGDKDITISYSGGTPSVGIKEYYNGSIPFIRSGEINSNHTELFITENGLANSSAKIVGVGDILYALYGATSGEVGLSQINGAINQAIMAIKPKAGYNPNFIAYWLRKEKNNIIRTYLQGGQGNLSSAIVKNLEVDFPKDSDEQQAIGNYFQNIDRLINTSQTKLDKLKNIKKACLEKIFPHNGSTTPELRFKGFTEEWKEQRLGDCADIIGGGTPDTSNREYWDGDIDWYSPAEIGDKVFVDGSKRKITELGLKESSAKVLPIGTVLFSSRAGIGSTAILAKKGATNQGFQSIIPHKGNLDTYFIFSRTRELKKYGETNGAGSTFIEISGKQMESMPIINPEIDEQQAIGNYFQNIDRLINTSQTKLDKLKNIKKACLEKMFVNTEDKI